MLFHSVAANNFCGVAVAGSGMTTRIAQSAVTGNGTGWSVAGGAILQSYGDNYIDGNGPNTGSLTLISRQ